MDENIKINNYKSFFGDQIKEAIDDQQKLNRSQMSQLFKTDELSLAYVERIQHETGMVILKFPRRMAPRLKVQKSITVIKKGARKELGEHVTEWSCLWEDFCKNPDYHSSGSDIIPLYYVQGNNDGYDYVACSGISTKLYDLFVKTTSEGKSLSVLIYNPFPPVDNQKNLHLMRTIQMLFQKPYCRLWIKRIAVFFKALQEQEKASLLPR